MRYQAGALLLSLVWGQVSVFLFANGWLSFLMVVYCIIAIARHPRRLKSVVTAGIGQLTECLFFMLLLFSGFYLFYARLGMGQTTMETLIFLISASVRLFFVIPRLSAMIDARIAAVDKAVSSP